jgi:PAS domain S-box-containing protein
MRINPFLLRFPAAGTIRKVMNPSSFFRNRSPGASSTLFGLLCAGLIIFGVAGFICFRQYESAKTGALNADNTAASLLATVLAEHERAKTGVLLSYAQRPLLIKAVKDRNLAAVHSHLEGMKRNNPEIDLIFLTDRDATIWANYPVFSEAIGQNVSDRDWYQGVRARWEPYTSAVFQLIVADKPLAVATVVPVTDENGESIGILGNSHRLDFMTKTIQQAYLHPDTTVNIIDQKGQLLFSNKYPFRDKITGYPLLPVVQQAIKGNEHLIEAREPHGADGKSYLTWYPVGPTGWTVIVERRQEDILRSAYRGFFEIGAIAILLFSLAAFFTFYHRKVVLLRKTEELLLAEKKLRESEQAEMETRARAEEEISRLLSSIREERDRLDSLIGSISDEIWFVDKKGRFSLANPTAMREFGVDATSPDEVEKLISSLEILRPDGMPRPLEESPGLLSLAGKAVRNLEEMVRIPASGELRYRQVSSSPVRDAVGHITGSVSVVRDITGLKKAEEKLRRSDATLRGMLEASQESIWLFGADGVILLANQTALSRIGKTSEDVIGRQVNEILSAELARSRMARLRETVESGQPQEFEDERSGIIFRHSFYPVLDAGGNVTHVVSFSRDITERKQAEQAVRDGEERLRFALETSHTGAWDLDLVDHTAFRSLEHDRIFGYAELLPQWTYEMFLGHVLAEDRAAVDAKFHHAIETRGDWGFECRIRRTDGEVRWILAAGRHRADAAGIPLRMAGIVQDITERKRAEEALRKSEEKFIKTFQSNPACIGLSRLSDGLVIEANDVMLNVLGYNRDAFIGHRIPELGVWANPADRERLLQTLAAEGRSMNQEYWLRTRTGELRLCNHSAEQIQLGDEPHVIFTFFDVTERKRAEEKLRLSEEALQQANEHLEQRVRERTVDLQNLTEQLERSRHELRKLASELVMAEERERKRIAGVLHDEIAQTLAAVRMRLEMLQDIPTDQKDTALKDAKALLVQSIQETRTLMNDLGNPLLFDMGLKSACEALAKRLMEAHPVRIRCDIQDAYKDLDPDMKTILYQVVRELLNNVVKHSHAQNAHVMIDMENGHFRVTVTDDGVGFEPQMLGAPTVEGGFGLYSIRERLIAVDGILRIESTSGTGTVMTAILPAALK